MKRKLFFAGVLLVPVVGMFLAARAAASWRPVRAAVAPGAYTLRALPHDWLETRSDWGVRLMRGDQTFVAKTYHGYAAVSPDDTLVALFDSGQHDWGSSITFSQPSLRVANIADGQTRRVWRSLPFRQGEEIEDGRFEQSGRVLAVATFFRVLRLDVSTGKMLSNVPMRFQNTPAEGCGMMSGVSFLKNGDLYYLNGDAGLVVDGRTGVPKRKADMGTVSPDESLVFFTYDPQALGMWVGDFHTGKQLWKEDTATEGDASISPDSRTFLVVRQGKTFLVDARTGKVQRELKLPVAKSYAFAPDGNAIYALREDGSIFRCRLK